MKEALKLEFSHFVPRLNGRNTMVNPAAAHPKSRRTCAASLRPQGLYEWVFVAARVLNFGTLVMLAVFIGQFLALPAKERQNQDTSLIATLILTNLALFWTVVSWSGYSKQLIRYAITWTIDLAFVIAFIGHIALIGVFLQNSSICTNPRNKKTPAICQTLNLIWFLSIAICALFAVSGFTIGWVHLSGRRPRSATLEGVVVDRRVGHGGRSSNSKMRGPPSTTAPRPPHRDLAVLQLANETYGGSRTRQIRVRDASSVRTMPFSIRQNRTELDPVEGRLWQQAHGARSRASHQTSITISRRPSPRRKHKNNASTSFASEPQLRDKNRVHGNRAKSAGLVGQRSIVSSRNGDSKPDTKTRGQLAAADILQRTGKTGDSGGGERKARTYFESIAAPVAVRPVRSFSPVSWIGNTAYSSEYGDSRRNNSVGEIPIQLSNSPTTTPITPIIPYTFRMSDEELRNRDPEAYALPKMTYVAPKEVPARYSVASYETEYASTSSADSVSEHRPNSNTECQRPGTAPGPSRPRTHAPRDGFPGPQTHVPAPWSRAMSTGPFSRSGGEALTQGPPLGSQDVRAQTRQTADKPMKSWWKLRLGASKDATEAPMELEDKAR
ncbi:hypothetical protein B0T14DRAFT_39337 [Immersiella caudata]|uniref:Uncharacterized protein n=1 Tax=Immersiella caudata TaxID=314043 RepID=A0AA39XEU8_9PEZI|nr:hypothetical protein B0T14DRAFT_39337 [Immersiella caudata]